MDGLSRRLTNGEYTTKVLDFGSKVQRILIHAAKTIPTSILSSCRNPESPSVAFCREVCVQLNFAEYKTFYHDLPDLFDLDIEGYEQITLIENKTLLRSLFLNNFANAIYTKLEHFSSLGSITIADVASKYNFEN